MTSDILLPYIIYVIINFPIFFLTTILAKYLNLLDIPGGRKIHTELVPYTGGIALSICLLLSLPMYPLIPKELSLIISFGFIVSLVGLLDDKLNLGAGNKIVLQIIPILLLLFVDINSMSLNTLGEYGFFNLDLGTFAIPFTLFGVLLLINTFNYFDGLDGSLTSTSLVVLIILFFLSPDENVRLYLLIIISTLIIFLFFNFSIFKLPKMFLGDSGSLTMGFIIAFILIYFANQNIAHPIVLAWSVALFVYEFLSINILRIKNKENLFKGGNDHLHHLLYKHTRSIFLTNFLMALIQIVFFIMGYLTFVFLSPFYSLIFFILFFINFFFIRRAYKYFLSSM